ncbi:MULTISPECIES: glycosyltransferase family 2 protein [unclassified Agrococcus]|uniref:glycosyltransferase family 2 protein n=1 Tax=unclassified Agrococcus TaxID=2615065 RepID=UPI003620102D
MTFDVMLPFYGRFDHLQLAVESVLSQTHEDLRLVVVDDVYPDLAPGEWVRSLGDPRVEYVRNEVNLGVSRNYLSCVDRMRSDYSMLMGCDDVMLPRFLERVHELVAEHPGVDVVQPGVRVIDGDGGATDPLADRVKRLVSPRGPRPVLLSGEPLARSLAFGNWTYFPSIVWKVETIRSIGFRAELDIVQDIGMLLDIARLDGSLVLDDEVVFAYRRHAASVSSATAVSGKRFDQERAIFEEQASLLAERGWPRAARAARRRSLSRLNALTQLPAALRAGDAAGRSALLRHALR